MSEGDIRIVVLPGDGIGPEVAAEAVKCLELVSERLSLGFRFESHDFGGIAIDRHGKPLPEATLEACRGADAILLGAVGGPKWDDAPERPEAGLLAIRKALGLFANLRPAQVVEGLESLSPLRADLAADTDVLVVRELTGGLYFGDKQVGDDAASDSCTYTREEVERIAHVAFRAAQRRSGRVTSVDKANVLATSKLWRRVVGEVAADYPDVALDHMYVDAAAMALVTGPRRFDVILTENLFGDILSDELSVIGGSIGLLGSASLGESPSRHSRENGNPAFSEEGGKQKRDPRFRGGDGKGSAGLYEPIHGSAPDIAGLDIANPAGAIASAAMMLDELGQSQAAASMRRAVVETLRAGCRTADLGGTAGCAEFGGKVRDALAAILAEPVAAERGA